MGGCPERGPVLFRRASALKSPPTLLEKLQAFDAANRRKPGPLCAACRLPEKDREDVIKAREKGITLRTISAVLAQEGHTVSAYTLGRHTRDHD